MLYVSDSLVVKSAWTLSWGRTVILWNIYSSYSEWLLHSWMLFSKCCEDFHVSWWDVVWVTGVILSFICDLICWWYQTGGVNSLFTGYRKVWVTEVCRMGFQMLLSCVPVLAHTVQTIRYAMLQKNILEILFSLVGIWSLGVPSRQTAVIRLPRIHLIVIKRNWEMRLWHIFRKDLRIQTWGSAWF